MLRRAALAAVTIGLPVLLVLLMMEVVLRLEPSLISLVMLDGFPVTLRTEIAERLKLPTRVNQNVIASADRFDKGPDLILPKPGERYPWPRDPADVAAGALEYREFDSRGFCNPPDAISSGPPDILVVAGSVPGCIAVDPASEFTARLAAVTGLRTYDMALGGVGPYEYVEILRRFGLALKPRIVVMAFSEANDLRDCRRYKAFVSGKKPVAVGFGAMTLVHDIVFRRPQGAWDSIISSSYALSFLSSGIGYAIHAIEARFDDDFLYSVEIKGQRRPLNVENGNLDELNSAQLMAAGKLDLDLCEGPLRQFAELGRQNGFVPVVIPAPAAYTAYQKTVAFDVPANGPLMAAYDAAQRKWLAANAARLGYVYVDPVDAMKEAALSAPLLYFPSNTHLTAAGHKLLADTVGPRLKALLPPAP